MRHAHHWKTHHVLHGAAMLTLLAGGAVATNHYIQNKPSTNTTIVATGQAIQRAGVAFPNPSLTPGDVLTTDVNTICTAGYTSTVRNVPQSEKDQVFSEYGIGSHQPGEYEADHLIPLELGGSNSIKNFWPQKAPDFHWKDRLENNAHSAVCGGSVDIIDAQHKIANDWLSFAQELGVGQ